ncbi:hypothetical protein [Enterovibrio coralii]|uniref:Uncharacterized protein n=1 Tax=Enterovibrio coralii TaxID=294935 RepID=A0A135I3C2_9GAMM|nr:hypothetical protein [Enterovibrio coralii]KXF79946.1 hypothetical protein ATN88_11885 [Enterovibrio coralii]
MEALQPLDVQFEKARWHADLVGSGMFWCDLLVDERFSAELGVLSQYIVDYRVNLKNEMVHRLEDNLLFLFCRREKVRFDIYKRPSYNFLTKKTKFHFVIGKERRKVSASVSLKSFFFEDMANPKILYDSKFVTFIKNEKDNMTLSVHDFLSEVGIELGIKSEVVGTGTSSSPYYGNTEFHLDCFQRETEAYAEKDTDLIVFMNEYQVRKSEGLVQEISSLEDGDEETPPALSDTELLMLSRCFSLYFLGDDTATSMLVKNAVTNLSRFMRRSAISRIEVDHAYDADGEYIRLSGQEVASSASHAFAILWDDEKLVVDRGEIY